MPAQQHAFMRDALVQHRLSGADGAFGAVRNTETAENSLGPTPLSAHTRNRYSVAGVRSWIETLVTAPRYAVTNRDAGDVVCSSGNSFAPVASRAGASGNAAAVFGAESAPASSAAHICSR